MALKNIKHWYDGKFYTFFVSPVQKPLFSKISSLIPDGSKVLDIACGPGDLDFMLAERCEKVTGVDLSKQNIDEANRRLSNFDKDNINFIHHDASELSEIIDEKYDFAVVSFAVHEMPPDIRLKVLEQMKQSAQTVIIADYVAPMPKTFYGFGVRLVEFLAGKLHFKNYKKYRKTGGIDYYVNELGFKNTQNIYAHNGHSRIAVLETKSRK